MATNVTNLQAAEDGTPKPDPMRFWERLKRTDPKATKPFTRSGGFRGTQIDPTWRLKMMTETFGPVGFGWGYEQVGQPVLAEGCVFICVRAWWRDPETGEQHWTGPQWGVTELIRRRRDGPGEPNDEAFKMSVTDAVGKCLLQIGLAADVHLGLFDDSKYRDDAAAYYAAKEDPQLRPEATARFEAEVKERLAELTDLDGLDELWRSGVSARVRDIGLVDRAAQMRIVGYFAGRKRELQAQEPVSEPGPSAGAPERPVERRSAPAAPSESANDRSRSSGRARADAARPQPARAAPPARRPPPPYRLRDEHGELIDDCPTIDDWLKDAAGATFDLGGEPALIADFMRHNKAELERMDREATPAQTRSLAEFRGVMDRALRNALDGPGREPAGVVEAIRTEGGRS